MDIFESFKAFNINGLNYLIFMIKSNIWVIIMMFAVIGTVIMELKAEVDKAVRDEHHII